MATANVVSATKDATTAYLSVAVAEGGKLGNVEYSASTPLLDDTGAAKTAAVVLVELRALITAQRPPAAKSVLAGVPATVTV
jgi:hypothetical protein